MSLRRPRSHRVGISNIDFRSKKDEENLRLFQQWQYPKDIGTMGTKGYTKPVKVSKNLFAPTKGINTLKDIVNDHPDPKYYTTAKLYQENNINLNIKSFINNERVSNLDETYKGKEPFIGDGMGISDIIKKRKGSKLYKKNLLNKDLNLLNSLEDKKEQIKKIEKLSKDKKRLNKNTIQETQLVKIKAQSTDNNLVNIKKIKEIKLAIRRRYGNMKNIHKIFQLWARSFPNKITIEDTYKMINSLNIPINYNEAKAFIALGSNYGKDFLNIEEFSNLIFNDDEKYISEPYKIAGGKIFLDEKEQKDFKEKVIKNNQEIYNDNNIKLLKNFISQRLINLSKNLKELSKEKYSFTNIINEEKNGAKKINFNKCNYDKFKKGILSLKPSKTFCKEEYIKSIFNEYKDNDDLIDMKHFSEHIYENNNQEFFTKLKDNLAKTSKDEIDKKRLSLQKCVSENKNNIQLIYKKRYDLDKQILEKKQEKINIRNEEKKITEEINCTVPSTSWIHHVYDNREEHYNILNRAECSLSAKPKPNIKRDVFTGNTRFSSKPSCRNTQETLFGDRLSSAYISEKERFNLDRNLNIDDKIKKEKIQMGRLNRIRTAVQRAEHNNIIKEFLQDEKKLYSDIEKANRQFNYDEIFKNKNFIIE